MCTPRIKRTGGNSGIARDWSFEHESWLGITWEEAFNCGLVTFHDKAYDGREAVFAKGPDQDGYPIGGEPRPTPRPLT